MASENDAVVSDTEHEEKPVREQLRKATISQNGGTVVDITSDPTSMAGRALEKNGEISTSSDREGSPARKRSFDEVDDDREEERAPRPARHHSRKRSRDSTAENSDANSRHKDSDDSAPDLIQSAADTDGLTRAAGERRPGTPEPPKVEKRGEAAVEAMASPKTKRSRLLSASLDGDSALVTEAPTDAVNVSGRGTADITQGSVPDTVVEDGESISKIPPTSAFANTSTTSPFASLSDSKSPTLSNTQTSSSAFAASGFSALSGTPTSGFGALGKSTGGFGVGGDFGSGSKSSVPLTSSTETDPKNSEAKSSNTFGGALGQQSAFSSGNAGSSPGSTAGSAFGGSLGLGSGFGSKFSNGGFASSGFGGLGGGAGLTSFASGKPSTTFGSTSKPVKAFGSPAENDDGEGSDEDGGGDDSGFKSPLSQESDKQDERFYAQELETGEEDETTEYSCRAKLYNFANVADGKKEWKERGLGVVRLNVKNMTPDKDANVKPRARLLMRAEGSHRVILNTPVKKEIRFGAPDGTDPKGGYVYFMGAVDGKASLELLQLKIRQQFAQELYERVIDLQAAM